VRAAAQAGTRPQGPSPLASAARVRHLNVNFHTSTRSKSFQLPRNMANAYQEIENRISQCVSDHPIHEFPKIARLARKYDVPYARLYHRYHGRQSKSDRPAPNAKLDSAQELALSEFLRRRDYMGLPMRIPEVEKAANSILKECYSEPSTPPPTVGEHWTRRWLEKHPEFHKRKEKAIDAERKEQYNSKILEDWYNRLQAITGVAERAG
jgi:hypothetical protein